MPLKLVWSWLLTFTVSGLCFPYKSLRNFKLFFFFLFQLCHVACGISVPQIGSESGPQQWKNRPEALGNPQGTLIIFFFFNLFFNGGKLLYNVVLVSASQHESVVIIHTSPPSWGSPSPPAIPALYIITDHQAVLPALCNNFSLAMCFVQDSVYMSMLLSAESRS